jgi:hypothetical protein
MDEKIMEEKLELIREKWELLKLREQTLLSHGMNVPTDIEYLKKYCDNNAEGSRGSLVDAINDSLNNRLAEFLRAIQKIPAVKEAEAQNHQP